MGLIIIIFSVAFVGCTSGRAAKKTPGMAAQEMRVVHKGHFVFHYFPSDSLSAEDMRFHNDLVVKIAKKLDVPMPNSKVHYYKYSDRKLKGKLTGDKGNAHAGLSGPPGNPSTVFEIHTIYARDNHEIVHVLLFPHGIPPSLLAEGIAVMISGAWHGRDFDEVTRELQRNGGYIPLGDLVKNERFRKDEMRSYPQAASFVNFLVNTWGMRKFLDLYRLSAKRVRENQLSVIRESVHSVYGFSLTDLEQRMIHNLPGVSR